MHTRARSRTYRHADKNKQRECACAHAQPPTLPRASERVCVRTAAIKEHTHQSLCPAVAYLPATLLLDSLQEHTSVVTGNNQLSQSHPASLQRFANKVTEMGVYRYFILDVLLMLMDQTARSATGCTDAKAEYI